MRDKPKLSIIIRTLNEEKWLPFVLESLMSQVVKNIEIIIVDSGSTDKTLKIAEKFNCKIVKITREKFSYPYALNIGFKEAHADYVGILSGHSVPISNNWAERGLEHFKDKQVAGISGPIQALPDANFFEKFYYFFSFLLWTIFPRFVISHQTIDNRNSIIRKSDWEKYNFDETLTNGSEDYDWALCMRKNFGRKVLFDSKFQAKHSHTGLGQPTDVELWWTRWRHENKKIRKKY